MSSYYMGEHVVQYNRTWKAFLQKTLEAAESTIVVEALKSSARRRQSSLRILDAGCGTGLLLERFAHLFPSAELYGIDASPDMLVQARQLLQSYTNIHLHHVRLSEGTEMMLSYPSAFFDLITCTDVLHYLQKPVIVLRSFREMLVKQGQLVLEDYLLRGSPFPWKWFEWAIRMYDPEHHALFSPEEAQRLCLQAGLHLVTVQTFPIDLFCQGWAERAIRQ